MNRKTIQRFILLIALVLALVFYWIKNKGNQVDDNFALPHTIYAEDIVLSKHAKCRMVCREISKAEILEILNKGKQNFQKTNRTEKGVSYAFEGMSNDGQEIRVVIAPKEEKFVVVTVIDLNEEWPCSCN